MTRRRSLLAGAALLLLLACRSQPPAGNQRISFIFWESYRGAPGAVLVDGRTLFEGPIADAEGSTAVSGGFEAHVRTGRRTFEFRFGSNGWTAEITVTPNTRFVYLTPLSTSHIQPSEKPHLLD